MAGAEPKDLPSKKELAAAYEAGNCPAWEETARWAGRYYSDEKLDWCDYQERIDAALRSGAVRCLKALWLGVYYHDRDCPDFGRDLLTAARWSDLETFLFALYARRHYSTLDGYDDNDFEVFVQAITQNVKLASWWGEVANQRAMYHLLGAYEPADIASDDLLNEVILEARDGGAHLTAGVLAGWQQA